MAETKGKEKKKCWVIQEEAKVTLATSWVGGVFTPDASGHPLKMSRDCQTSAVKKQIYKISKFICTSKHYLWSCFSRGKTHSAELSALPQGKHGRFVSERDRDLYEVSKFKWAFMWWCRLRLTLEKSLWTADGGKSWGQSWGCFNIFSRTGSLVFLM